MTRQRRVLRECTCAFLGGAIALAFASEQWALLAVMVMGYWAFVHLGNSEVTP